MALGPHRQSRPVRSVAQGFPVRWLVSTQATAWHGRYNSPTKSGRRVWRYTAHIQKREYSSPYSFFWQSSVRLSGVSGELKRLKLPRGLCMPLSLVLETQGFELSSTRPEIRKPNARFKRTYIYIYIIYTLDYISWGTIQLALISRLRQCNNLNPFENRRLSRIQAIHLCRQWESKGSGLVRSCIFMAKT